MPDTTDRFDDLPILQELRSDLIAAARDQEANRHAVAAVRWLSRRMNASVMAVAFVLAGGAIAVAATGVLNGSPVKRQGPAAPNAGIGVPAPGGSRLLALSAADPQGGLPWGMRLVHTTRGEICVQIGRLDDGQLGQLGIDGAFHDDGRFHPLAPDVLPETSDSGDVSCNLASAPIRIGSWADGDRSAAPSPERSSFKPTAADLRSISWGLLGPHAVSLTYHTPAGVVTRPVAPGTGAYLVVGEVSRALSSINGGGELVGSISGHEVAAGFHGGVGGVIAATFRFGSFTCSIGNLVPGTTRCPTYHPTPESRIAPTRDLNMPVQVTLRTQPRASCSAAYLANPCYRAEIRFKAPFAVKSAGSEYFVQAKSSCAHARASSWSFTNDIHQGQTVRTESSGLFNCTSDEFKVQYIRDFNNSHPSGIVGTATLHAAAGG
ncbi:MAG: hypothetical protein ABSG93_12885 [Solirubrobacteraceae bacterium]|jgi:hypothetical protein